MTKRFLRSYEEKHCNLDNNEFTHITEHSINVILEILPYFKDICKNNTNT